MASRQVVAVAQGTKAKQISLAENDTDEQKAIRLGLDWASRTRTEAYASLH